MRREFTRLSRCPSSCGCRYSDPIIYFSYFYPSAVSVYDLSNLVFLPEGPTGLGLRIWCEELLQDLWLGTVACPSHMVRKLHHDHHCTLEELVPMVPSERLDKRDVSTGYFHAKRLGAYAAYLACYVLPCVTYNLGSWTCSLPSGLVCFLYVSRCCFLAATNFNPFSMSKRDFSIAVGPMPKDLWGSESGHHHHGDSSSLHCLRVTLAKLRLIWTHEERWEWILRTNQSYRWHIRRVSGFISYQPMDGRRFRLVVLPFLDILAVKICKHPLGY